MTPFEYYSGGYGPWGGYGATCDGMGGGYAGCVDCSGVANPLPSPAEYRRMRRFYRDLNRLRRKYPHLSACLGISGTAACDAACGDSCTETCCTTGCDPCGGMILDGGCTTSFGPMMSTSCGAPMMSSGCGAPTYGQPMAIAPGCSAPMMSAPTYSTPGATPTPAGPPIEPSQYLAPPLPQHTTSAPHLLTPPSVSASPNLLTPPPTTTHTLSGPSLPAPSAVQQAGWNTSRTF